ncbi:vitamin K epoxide reductase family protein [Flavobacteriaceae bacterium M23B6Z8]
MEHPLIFVVDKYLDKSGVRINRNEIKLQLLSHPYFPNILSVSDLFYHFDLEHFALKVSNTEDSLQQLPEFFLAHLEDGNEPKLFLVQQKESYVNVFWQSGEKRRMSLTEFLESWTGVLIVLEETSKHQQQNDEVNSSNLKIFGVLFLVTLFVFLIRSFKDISSLLFLGSVITGFVVSYFIIQHELGRSLKTLNKFCKSSEKTSCDEVINSDGALLFGRFKLSDLSIIYFSTQLLFILISSLGSLNTEVTLSYLSTFSIPLIGYSLYYQGLVVKKWCPLCLGLVAVLVFQFCTLLLAGSLSFNLIPSDVPVLVLFTLLYSLVAFLWFYFSPLLHKEIRADVINIKYLKFKRDYTFFKHALSQMPTASKYYGASGEIVFGNPESDLKIISVTNPTCHYCIEAHNHIERILSKYGKEVCIKIRFNLMNLKMEKTNARASHYFLKVYNASGEAACRKEMHDFYNAKEKESWLYSKENQSNPEFIQILEMHKAWCKENSINFTPSIIIADKLYPKKFYGIEDLEFFIEDLIKEEYHLKKTYEI